MFLTEKALDHDSMLKVLTDNAKYVRRGAELVVQYNPDWSCEVGQANCGKEEGAQFQYADTMIT